MRKYQQVTFDISAFDHGSFFLLQDVVVELLYVVTLATGMRGISGNEQSQDVGISCYHPHPAAVSNLSQG